MVEQLTLNQLVPGSSPGGATTFGGNRVTIVLLNILGNGRTPPEKPPQSLPV